MAMEARCALELDARAPEGIELFRWIWASNDLSEVVCPLPNGDLGAFAVPQGGLSPVMDTVTILPLVELVREPAQNIPGLRARCGWDTNTRIAVLFLLNGGKDIEKMKHTSSYFSDADMHTLADSGRAFLGTMSPHDRLRDML